MKRALVTMMAATLVLGLGGQPVFAASTAESSAAETAKGDILIGLAMHNQTADWAVQFKDSFIEEAKAKGADVSWNDANAVAATQVNNIDDLIAQKVNVLVVDPADYTALGQALQHAKDAGIPVVNVDSKVDDADQQYVASFVTADCYKGGYTLGEYLADKLPDGATVGQLNYPQISVIADRFKGMQAAFKDKKRDDIKIIDKTCTDLNAINTYTEDMLMANPEISCFVCLNDNTALSCYATCKQLDHADALVYGFDGSPAGKQSISEGQMAGTMVYSPVDLAKTAADTAYAIATGGDYEKETLVDMWLIDPDNIADRDLEHWE